MKLLKNEILNSFTFQAMHLTESPLIDSHITDTKELKATAEHLKNPSFYWLHKKPFKYRFISASSKCTTTEISVILTSVLTTRKELIVKYGNVSYENNAIN